jgi:hypothetical protein
MYGAEINEKLKKKPPIYRISRRNCTKDYHHSNSILPVVTVFLQDLLLTAKG